MITVINSKKIFQADPDTGENIGVHIYELVGASTDIAGTKEGFLEWIKQNDIPVNMPGAFGNGSTFYAIDTKKKFIFFNGQFYELPTQGGGGSDPVDTVYDMVVKITIDETFEETGNLVANYTYDEIRDAIISGKNVCGVLNIEGTAFVFDNLAYMVKDESYVIRFTYMGAGIANGTDPLISDVTCWMHSDSSIPYAELEMNTIELATAGGGGGSDDTLIVTFSENEDEDIVTDKTCSEILDAIMQARQVKGYYSNPATGVVYILDVVNASDYGVQFESCTTFRNSMSSVDHEVVTLYVNSDNTVDMDGAYYTTNERTSYYITHDTQGNIISADGELDDAIASQVRLFYEADHKYYDFYDSTGDLYIYMRVDFGISMDVKKLVWNVGTNEITYSSNSYQLTPFSLPI